MSEAVIRSPRPRTPFILYPFYLSRLKLTFTFQRIYAKFESEKTPDSYGIYSIKRLPHKYAVDKKNTNNCGPRINAAT